MEIPVAASPRSPLMGTILDGAETLSGALATLVERFPQVDGLTVVTADRQVRQITMAEFWARARDVGAALSARGARPGEIVLIALPTGPELVAAYFAVILAGLVPGLVATPTNRVADRRLYARRVGALLANADAAVLYGDEEVAAIFRDLETAPLLGRTRLLTPAEVGPAGQAPPPATPDPDAMATVQYSSGSTGTPKGVVLTHRAMLNNIRAVRAGLRLTPADVSVNWIPLYHDMGLIDAFLLPLLSGCRTVLIPTMDFLRDPALWLWTVHHYRGALSWAPNFAYAICAKRVPERELEGLDLSSWRVAINAAEPVLAATIAAFTTRFRPYGFRPQALTPAWGLAENVTIATAHPVDEPPAVEHIDRQELATGLVARPVAAGPGALASVAIGRCLPGCAVEIRGPAGEVLPDRGVGTVWLHSDSLFTGYHRDAAATRQVLVDGWLNTGDRGYRVGDDLFFIAREKDLIVIAGEKYAPHDIETAINRVPGVREGCVVAFGMLDEQRGTEDVAAVVETKEADAAALERLREAIREAVMDSTGLALRHVLLVPPGGVEKTTSGKLARRATRQRWAEQLVS